MIDKFQLYVLNKFAFVSILIFLSNVISSLLWYKNLVFESVYINCFCFSLFGIVIWISKILIRILPDLKVAILLGSIGIKMIFALLFIMLMLQYNTTNKNGLVLVFMANYFLYLGLSVKFFMRDV